MLFQDITLRPPRPAEPDALHTIWPTTAEPRTFAPPLGVEEDETHFTLLFDVAGRDEDDLEVHIDGQTLFILGEALPRTGGAPRRARRAFALPASVDPARTWMDLAPPTLKVRVAKATASGRRTIPVGSK